MIATETVEENLRLLRIILDRLRCHGLRVNLPKSHFLQSRINYLGHVAENGTLRPQPKKVQTLRSLITPKDASDLRKVLGALGYYRHYIPA